MSLNESRLADLEPTLLIALAILVRQAEATEGLALGDLVRGYRDALISQQTDFTTESPGFRDSLLEQVQVQVLPQLVAGGWIADDRDGARARVVPIGEWWQEALADREAVSARILDLAFPRPGLGVVVPAAPGAGGSMLECEGLNKAFKRRKVVRDVSIHVAQGEVIGLLGPNGAGKTTTFYLITGLIRPDSGKIRLDGRDITRAPMFRRARSGIGYLAQEPSVFRKLTVEQNVLAILETQGLKREERQHRLEGLLDELSIKHLRKAKAYSLSGGERRRLEITRALVTRPKFMLLDEPFAGVDPIAVHDIQTIVSGLRHRGIGVVITDHNVEQTLEIVDRAYIMFEGSVQASGTVRELVYNDQVADLYLGTDPHGPAQGPDGEDGVKQGLTQHTGLRQELRINPRLYQAMDMLYMPMMDLQQHLKQELLVNPFLELVEPEEEESGTEKAPDAEQEKEKAEKEQEIDWEEILLNGFDVGGTKQQFEVQDYLEPVAIESADLIDHLRGQLNLLPLTPRQALLGEELLGHIGDDGYLATSLDEVLITVNQMLLAAVPGQMSEQGEEDYEELEAAAASQTPAGEVAPGIPLFTLAEVEAALRMLHTLDPPGVGARDLRECLLLQMTDDTNADPLARQLVSDSFEDLKAHRWNDLAKRYSVEPARVQTAADSLGRYDPKPGLKYANRSDGYIIPDLVVEKVDGIYHVFLNDTGMPRLRLSRSYQEIARERGKLTQENREFITTKMNSANWMIQAIEQRRQTMLKVMNFIVDRQRAFFEKGVEYLKPLTLREVADVISMHESTVSRVTNEKYVQTPRGVLPLKFFFSSALSTASGEEASARSIRAKLQKMVGEEDPAKPLTDQQIVHLFQEQGIQIARRTVAKYRDQLGILPARMRKRV